MLCVKLYTVCKITHLFLNYTFRACDVKAVSFGYQMENFTLGWISYTASGCDGCDKYQVCSQIGHPVHWYWYKFCILNTHPQTSPGQHLVRRKKSWSCLQHRLQQWLARPLVQLIWNDWIETHFSPSPNNPYPGPAEECSNQLEEQQHWSFLRELTILIWELLTPKILSALLTRGRKRGMMMEYLYGLLPLTLQAVHWKVDKAVEEQQKKDKQDSPTWTNLIFPVKAQEYMDHSWIANTEQSRTKKTYMKLDKSNFP